MISWETSNLFFKVPAKFTIQTAMYDSSHFSTTSQALDNVYFCLFLSLWCEMVSHDFDLKFPSDKWYLLMSLSIFSGATGHLYIVFGEMCVYVLCSLFILVISFLLLSSKNSLYILVTLYYKIYDLQIFSLCGISFIFFMVFLKHELFNFNKFQFFYFFCHLCFCGHI